MQITTVLSKTNIPVTMETNDGRHFRVSGDTVKRDGFMRFANEWQILITADRNNILLSSGFEIAASEIRYSAEDGQMLFEHRHPGILQDLHDFIANNKFALTPAVTY